MAQMIGDAINQAAANFLNALTRLLPQLVIAIVLVALGWVIAILLRSLVRLVLGWLRFNTGAERVGLTAPLKAAGLPQADVLIGSIVFWVVWLGFLLSGIDVIQFRSLEGLLARFTAFIPQIIVAIVILVVGVVIANFVWRATLLAAVNAHVPSPRLIGGAVRFLVMTIVVAMALEQAGVAPAVVITGFAIAFGGIVLALSIAIGIGASGLARRIFEQRFPEADRPAGGDEISHL